MSVQGEGRGSVGRRVREEVRKRRGATGSERVARVNEPSPPPLPSSPEDLHAGLRVGVVGGLEAQLFEAEAVEKRAQRADEVPQRQAAVTHEALDLIWFVLRSEDWRPRVQSVRR